MAAKAKATKVLKVSAPAPTPAPTSAPAPAKKTRAPRVVWGVADLVKHAGVAAEDLYSQVVAGVKAIAEFASGVVKFEVESGTDNRGLSGYYIQVYAINKELDKLAAAHGLLFKGNTPSNENKTAFVAAMLGSETIDEKVKRTVSMLERAGKSYVKAINAAGGNLKYPTRPGRGAPAKTAPGDTLGLVLKIKGPENTPTTLVVKTTDERGHLLYDENGTLLDPSAADAMAKVFDAILQYLGAGAYIGMTRYHMPHLPRMAAIIRLAA